MSVEVMEIAGQMVSVGNVSDGDHPGIGFQLEGDQNHDLVTLCGLTFAQAKHVAKFMGKRIVIYIAAHDAD